MKFISKELIDKGWSGDKKYKVIDECGKAFLYRVSPENQYERSCGDFEYMQKVASLGIPMCMPVEFGKNEDGVYIVQSFIDGTDAEEAIKGMDDDTAYRYGLDSGRMLKSIHSIEAPENVMPWSVRFNAKIDRKIKMYTECALKYEKGELLLEYIAAHRHLLSDRTQTFQHGDYHIGNMMIGKDGQLYVIDFEKCDFGDPWEEFNRIVWCVPVSSAFASGMVDGYFDGEVPMEFWQLLALYISSNTLSSLPWAIKFGEDEIRTMRKQMSDVLLWYDDMRRVVPTWYIGGKM